MRVIKRGFAILLAVLLLMPAMPVSAQSTGDIVSDDVEITSEVVSEDVSEVTSEDVSEETSEDVSEETSEDVSEETSEDVSEETSEDVSEETSEDVSEETSEDVSEETSEDVSEETSEDVSEETSEDVSEETSEDVNEEVSEEAEEPVALTAPLEQVTYNTGDFEISVVDMTSFENGFGDIYFEEDGSYTIFLTEANPFFPYEVQFEYNGEVTTEWFMTPDDSVVIGGHTFYIFAEFDNTVVTSMTLDVAGDKVVVYPEAKEFTNDGGISTFSLLPLEEKYLYVDLTGYSPLELSQVSIDSVFTGENALSDTDSVIWQYKYDDGNYAICSANGSIDLSQYSSYEMIVGDPDQLAADNIRYNVSVSKTGDDEWLIPTVYTQDVDGNRTNISILDYYYYASSNYNRFNIDVSETEMGGLYEAFVGFKVNTELFPSLEGANIKVFEGKDATGKDVTAQFFATDMSQKDAGYEARLYYVDYLTMVLYDANNNVTGSMTFYIDLELSGSELSSWIYKLDDDGNHDYVSGNCSSHYENDIHLYTYSLYSGLKADDTYALDCTYYDETNTYNNDMVTAAYVGTYDSIAAANAAGATDIKESLLGSGYETVYKEYVYFTVFVGADGSANQEVYHIGCKVEETEEMPYGSGLNSGTAVTITGLKDANGASVDSYVVSYADDSYGERNFYTIMVAPGTDLTNLALVFTTSEGVNLYTAGSSAPEKSGESYHDFSGGMLQYTAAAEDGENSMNYWVQIVEAKEGTGSLYMNSLADAESETTVQDGVIYTTRQVMLDGYHNYIHDIFLANMGTEDISSLSVTLESDVVELDPYWTLTGNYNLAGFSTLEETTNYGELPNLAKVRLLAKEDAADGTDVSGTLTFKSGDKTLMVVTLTGTVGDPSIVTTEIPESVLYVPYGTMIQNSNKYSWNKVSYELDGGTLPLGMEVKPNGEIYGVPLETGEFKFWVRMTNSSSYFSNDYVYYTMVVKDNTDANVDAETDEGYDLTERITYVSITADASGSQRLVSQGEHAQFVDIYLDGVKLEKGTDYTTESGSTIITIMTQTLIEGGADSVGTHTLGIEFRTEDTNTLKCAAQNFTITETEEDASEGGAVEEGGDTSEDSGEQDDSSSSSSSSSSASNGAGSLADVSKTVVTPTQYTIQSGDTLWKIAQKFYGSGDLWTKVFADNAGVISDPNKIYVGQVILIYGNGADNNASNTASNLNYDGTTYTVVSGDSLWKIANKVYGNGRRWNDIYELNKDIISSPEKIYVGQVIRIPE